MGDESKWKFFGHCSEGTELNIAGVNVWGHKWTRLAQPKVHVKDPVYGSTFEFGVYEINAEGKRVLFAAGEFSCNYWGFYIPE